MKRNLGFALLGIATLLIGGSLLLAGPGRGNTGEVVQIETALRPTATTTTQPSAAESDSDLAAGEATTTTTTAPPAVSTTTPPLSEPIGLRIDALGVDAPVGSYGVDDRTGQMDVPDNVTEVGWYRFGAKPGEPGSAVLAAHVDLAGSGPGVFFELDSLAIGDTAVVTYEDGTEQAFRVIARTTYSKDDLPLDVIFSREGPPVLTLITCGGGFNRSLARYDSNVVVYAVPDSGNGPTSRSSL